MERAVIYTQRARRHNADDGRRYGPSRGVPHIPATSDTQRMRRRRHSDDFFRLEAYMAWKGRMDGVQCICRICTGGHARDYRLQHGRLACLMMTTKPKETSVFPTSPTTHTHTHPTQRCGLPPLAWHVTVNQWFALRLAGWLPCHAIAPVPRCFRRFSSDGQ